MAHLPRWGSSSVTIELPDFTLVLLVGASGSGKSTFAGRHFRPTEVLSSDFFRGLVSDNENDQAVSTQAFETLHYVLAKRLELRRLTVVDATNVQSESRKPLLALAKKYHVRPVAFVLDIPEEVCLERNQLRPDRQFGRHVVAHHRSQLRRSMKELAREGVREIHRFSGPEEVEAVSIQRVPLWTDRRGETGPFDLIGDVHGCYDELVELMEQLGYRDGRHPEGRRAIFLGDLVDRGPKIPEVLRLVMDMVARGQALCLPGNHDVKLVQALRGKNVQVKHGLSCSLEQLEGEGEAFKRQVLEFLDGLVSHYELDGGRLVVAHAGMKAEMAGRASGAVRSFALYGETTGETDEFGLPVRYNWAAEYSGRAMVVYGHTPVPQPEWLNRTLCIDTGCVFGGALTALRYPERELVSVKARAVYSEPVRPLGVSSERSLQQQHDDVLELSQVLGKHYVRTRLKGLVSIREENANAALEVMSRFAVNPRWLVYLPPTMSPAQTSARPDLLEHPDEAFDDFARQGVERVICQEKHMGSRAVAVVCRDAGTARSRFGVESGIGCLYTRTGRPFFEDQLLELAVLARLQSRLAPLFEELNSGWVVLDCELMPWSAKAQSLLRGQYAAVGAAGRGSLARACELLRGRGELEERFVRRREDLERFTRAYRRYCWRVDSPDDLKLAPFHLLASEGAVHADKDHLWHMEKLALTDLETTRSLLVELSDRQRAVKWWEELTEAGGEGMVVKPLEFVARGPKGLVQPALKCRGREYLRLIYGPEYTARLSLLRKRSLASKRSLALREFALGLEALERFVAREPLGQVHQCVFGVLALESEPVDPRL